MFLRYLHFYPDIFGYVGKRLDKKAELNFKIYGVTNWNTNNCYKYIDRYIKGKSNQTMKVGQLTEYKVQNIFFQKSLRN